MDQSQHPHRFTVERCRAIMLVVLTPKISRIKTPPMM
jgi:hypothetical protein